MIRLKKIMYMIVDYNKCKHFCELNHIKKETITKAIDGKILFVDFIEEDKPLRDWYIKNGFIHKDIEKYDHLIFTVGKAECLL